MKREKNNIKKIIKAKISIQQKGIADKPLLKKNEVLTSQKMIPDGRDVSQFSKRDRSIALNSPNFIDNKIALSELYRVAYNSLKVDGYVKKTDVDYDVIICVSSFNRFDKVNKLLSMFYTQDSNYSYKVILLDDNSTDDRYMELKEIYPNIEYYKNNKNNGRKLYWYTVTQLWQYAKNYKSNTILMIDDDFLLCDNFLNTICDLFYYIKNENNNVVGIAPHLHSYMLYISQMDWWFNTYSVDGVCLFDRNFIESFNYQLEIVSDDELKAEAHAHGWSQIQKRIKLENKMVYKTKYSLVYHDGNDESRLGGENKSKAYTFFFKKEGYNYVDLIV